MNNKVRILYATFVMILVSQANLAIAIGTGSSTIGPVGVGSQSTGYLREWIRLEPQGPLLVGRPSTGPIKLITTPASDLAKVSLLLRWADRADGKTSLLMTSDRKVVDNISNLTIYTEVLDEGFYVYEDAKPGWRRVEGWTYPTTANDIRLDEDPLVAYSTTGIGSFWIVNSAQAKDTDFEDFLPAAHPISQGSFWRAISNWIWPLLLFLAISIIVRIHHRFMERRGI